MARDFHQDGAVRFLAAASARRWSIQRDWHKSQQELQAVWPRKGHTVIAVIHEGDMGLDAEDATDVVALLQQLKAHEPVDVILHTHGGSAAAANRIAAALVRRRNTAAFVPFYAESAVTELALATEQIFLGKGAHLSPIDIHIEGTPARDIVQLARDQGAQASEGLKLAARVAERALRDEARSVVALIHANHKSRGGTWLAHKLTGESTYHGEAIRIAKARRMGLVVKSGVPDALYALIGTRRAQLRQLRELDMHFKFLERREPAEEIRA